MSAPKISAMENEPRNLTIGTLIRVAHALGGRVEIKLVRRKATKPFEASFVPQGKQGGEVAGEKSKTASLRKYIRSAKEAL